MRPITRPTRGEVIGELAIISLYTVTDWLGLRVGYQQNRRTLAMDCYDDIKHHTGSHRNTHAEFMYYLRQNVNGVLADRTATQICRTQYAKLYESPVFRHVQYHQHVTCL